MTHKIHGLDLFRGALAVLVLIPHAWQVFITPYQGINGVLGVVARSAVLLFFCLSGFVISMSIDNNRNRGQFSLLDYISARTSRIIPPLIGAMLLVAVLAMVLQLLNAGSTSIVGAARHAFLSDIGSQGAAIFTLGTSGNLSGYVNGPLWTLAYEIKFYAISGLLAVIVWKHPVEKFLALVSLWNLILGGQPLSSVLSFLPVVEKLFFVAYFFGSAMYWIKPRTGFLICCLSACIVVFVIFLLKIINSPAANLDEDRTWILLQCLVVAAGTFCVALVARSTIETSFGIGRWSYSLYILHFPLLLFIWMVLNHFFSDFSKIFRYPLMFFSAILVLWLCSLIGTRLESFRVNIFTVTSK